MPNSNNHIQDAESNISAATTNIKKANAFLDQVVTWIDTETKNMVIGTRFEFLRDRGAI